VFTLVFLRAARTFPGPFYIAANYRSENHRPQSGENVDVSVLGRNVMWAYVSPKHLYTRSSAHGVTTEQTNVEAWIVRSVIMFVR
jgi:hypothetical protein